MEFHEIYDVVDMHAGGEPLRIILSGYPPIPGRTVLDRRAYLEAHYDHLRQRLMFEPWGHQDMYGCLLVPAERPDSLYGLIFMHNAGYSTMCGHATFAVTKWAVETGQVALQEGDSAAEVRFDVPSGQVVATAALERGRVTAVAFENVPSYVVRTGLELSLEGRTVAVSVAFGGAFYAIVSSHALGLSVEPETVDELREWARQIKKEVSQDLCRHPFDARLDGLYGVIFTDYPKDPSHTGRHLTVFADGQVDRSPCGSCVSAHLALLEAQEVIQVGDEIAVESVIDSVFRGKVTGYGPKMGPHATVRTEISGEAHWIGMRRFFVNSHDPVAPFLVR